MHIFEKSKNTFSLILCVQQESKGKSIKNVHASSSFQDFFMKISNFEKVAKRACQTASISKI
jgi:hypothetical protein